jgi:hypothetical protein
MIQNHCLEMFGFGLPFVFILYLNLYSDHRTLFQLSVHICYVPAYESLHKSILPKL